MPPNDRPDEYVKRRGESLEQAKRLYEEFARKGQEAKDHGATVDLAHGRQLWDSYESKRKAYQYAHENHPNQFLGRILSEAKGVKAPEQSTFDWIRKNPSLLTAMPKSPEQRDMDARRAWLADRVREQSERFPQGHELNPLDTRGQDGGILAGLAVDAEMGLKGDLMSPYNHRKFNRDEHGDWQGMKGLAMEPLNAAGAAFAGVGRWRDHYLHAGKSLSSGHPLEALSSVASSFPALVSPALTRGSPGSETDWRPAAENLAPWIDGGFTALEFAMNGRPAFARKGRALVPFAAPAGNVNEAHNIDELRRAYHAASRRNHPDLGGSPHVQKEANRAFQERNLSALEGLLAPAR